MPRRRHLSRKRRQARTPRKAASVCDRLHHSEISGRLALHDQFGLSETELARCGQKLLLIRGAPDARTGGADGAFDEDRIGCDVPQIVGARNHESLGYVRRSLSIV